MRECDLIMKGGVTSGVAYPGAVARLAGSYRLRDIGGTSAGAIAAVLAATAEYRRQRALDDGGPEYDKSDPERRATADAGFVELAALAHDLGGNLASLFQPVPELRPLYRTLLAVARASPDARAGALARGLARAFAPLLALSALPGAILLLGGQVLAGVLLVLVVPLVALVLRVAHLVFKVLPRHDFGLCTGLTTDEGRLAGRPAFTDWMHAHVEAIAGPRDPERAPGAPLTVGDLAPHDIRVASVTTDLSSRRPWQLPLAAGAHLFSRAEFDALFPRDVVDYLVESGGAAEGAVADGADGARRDDLHRLPDGPRLPLVVLARLSLSFPGLVGAVPLYRADPDVRDGADAAPRVRRCLFSDGGISSNFPVHFFDGFLPSRPTFGIGFAALDPSRHGAGEEGRVHLTEAPPPGTYGGVHPVDGVAGFLGAIVNTAKDWQDTLQSRLPGYAERIVEIRLDAGREGGLHVEMDRPTVDYLATLGERAAERLEREFDFDTHRWLRARVLLPTLEERLARLAEVWARSGGRGSPDYETLLTTWTPGVFPLDPAFREEPLATFARALVALGGEAVERRDDPDRLSLAEGPRPTCDAGLRLVASPDATAPADCPPPSPPSPS